MSRIIDISLPIETGMWSYRPEWKNTVTETESVLKGGKSTVYNLDLYSHTGTYIETCEHKIPVQRRLDDLALSDFHAPAKVVQVAVSADNAITLPAFLSALAAADLQLESGDRLIVFSGYGINYKKEDYLKRSPWFEKELTYFLAEKKLSLLGVDSPIIECQQQPYQPVNHLFTAHNSMLLLAPLVIDKDVPAGVYTLSCFPLPVKNISGCLCRAILIP